MEEKKHYPPIVKLAVLTVVTAFIWIGFDIYRAFTVKPPPDVPPEVLAELDPSLPMPILDNLEERVYFDESSLGSVETVVNSPLPEATPEATATPSSEESTEGGQITP